MRIDRRCLRPSDGGVNLTASLPAAEAHHQHPRGVGRLAAGLLLMPQGVGALASRFVVGRLVDRLGARAVTVAGFALAASSTIPFAVAGPAPGRRQRSAKMRGMADALFLTLLRHATLGVEVAGLRLLVDPMLGAAGTSPAIAGTPAARPNPLVELPVGWEAWLENLDAILVTHTHSDHLDPAAVERLVPLAVPVLCQPEDAGVLRGHGFADVRPVESELALQGVAVHRTGGRHGVEEELIAALAPVSGFVLRGAGRAVYLTGDTVWCAEVEDAVRTHRPDVVVANSGGARFLEGDRIVMDAWDLGLLAAHAPQAALVAVHLEAINHCLLTRERLRWQLEQAQVTAHVPRDGERLVL